MFTQFTPEIDKVYFINNYTLLHIVSGSSGIQVDFKNYFDWQNKIMYVSKGQYIKFLSDDFCVHKIELPDENTLNDTKFRVLFKHLISLGYINFDVNGTLQTLMDRSITTNDCSMIIDFSTKQWYKQNPFKASKEEYQLIFDTKDVIDQQYPYNISIKELTDLINTKETGIPSLIKNKIGISIKRLLSGKKILESKKEIAFTDKSIKEISYDLGYTDPAYFTKVFTNEVGVTPIDFRNNFDYKHRDLFCQDIIALLKQYHAKERTIDFYASKMKLSPKALSRKVKEKMQTSLGKLIRYELVHTSKSLLLKNLPVKEIALELGFEEPNHFSNFFKHYTGESPSDFKCKIYKN